MKILFSFVFFFISAVSFGKPVDSLSGAKGMMQSRTSNDLPYDAEVEYLETSSSEIQYIDTGFVPTSDRIVFDMTILRRNADSGFIGYGYNWREGLHIQLYSGNGINLHYGGTVYYIWAVGSGVKNTRIHIHFGDGFAYSENLDNGVTVSCQLNPADFSKNTQSIWLLNSNPGIANAPNVCYHFSISDGEDTLMDMIPVRIGSVGYMYDRVSGELFGNKGTGSFIIGPDL